ncbi:alpha-(1,6)-fucosyltransferase-like [Penaeus monodon]|uniref:alpha-(1,6)-fucosyltransferase-like n=1 Tax=Penaeus monodon TaxID=6687 RepID=UPI0018A7DCB4|nr:alpha-(1,6)-fucosyltransferase-like [Penaeus monodon]
MEAVDDYFSDLEMRRSKVTRKIYIATDDMEVIVEAKKKYPNYEILFNKESVASASMDHRDSQDNKRFLMADVYFLSRSDFLVCGMSSNVSILNKCEYSCSCYIWCY